MHILCVLRKLSLPGSGDPKEGVYPVMLRAHVRAGFRTAVAVGAGDNPALEQFCRNEGMTFVRSSRRSTLMGVLRYLAVGRTRSWADFIWKYRRMLDGIDRYIADEGRPDLIVGLQACVSAGKVAYLVGRRHNIPLAVRENSTLYTRKRMVGGLRATIRDVVRSSSRVLTVSQTLGQNMERELGMAIPQQRTMPNPVADTLFDPPVACEWIESFARNRFVFAGWTGWRDIKRIDIAIDAFAKVHARFSQTCLIIAGPVPAGTQDMIQVRGLEESVLLTGSLNRQGIRELAHASDCCIVTSDHDPGNNSVLEAMAAGTPSIVTSCGGSESRITEPWLGETVEPGNADAFAEAMCRVLAHRDRFDRGRISDECRVRYSEMAFTKRLVAIYEELRAAPDAPEKALRRELTVA